MKTTAVIASDPEQLALLDRLPPGLRAEFLAAATGKPVAEAQELLVERHRIYLSQPVLAQWLEAARAQAERERFSRFLGELRENVASAQAIVEAIGERLVLQDAALRVLLCRLIDSLQTGDRQATLDFASAIAALLPVVTNPK